MIPIISVIVGITTVAAAPADHYQSRYDHLDIESILNNRRMVNYYAACLLSQGPCPPQGLDLKSKFEIFSFPEILGRKLWFQYYRCGSCEMVTGRLSLSQISFIFSCITDCFLIIKTLSATGDIS